MLGLSDCRDGASLRLRGFQHANVRAAALARTLIQALAAIATTFLVAGQVQPLFVTGWLAVLLLSLWHSRRIDLHLGEAGRAHIDPEDMTAQSIASVVNALVWAVPLAAIDFLVDAQTQIKVWSVQAMLMTGCAVLLPSLPLSTLLFSGIVGSSAIAFFLVSGHYDMAILAALFIAIVSLGTVQAGRRYLAAKIAEAGMIEKDEVVSLLLREFEEGDGDWLWQTDASRRLCSVSPRFAFALGLEAHEAEGASLVQLLAAPARETERLPTSLHALAERLARREHFSGLLVDVTIAGERRWWELSGTPRLDDNGNFDGFHGAGSDVTAARESSEKIAWLARYDMLTQLPNRMMLTETLGNVLEDVQAQQGRCAFLMIDLDRFKAINDTLGHVVGDQLLARVSGRLAEAVSDTGVCGRLGGDEFAIVVRDASDPAVVTSVAERVIHRLSQPYQIDHHTLFVGASVGSAMGPRDGGTVETLMRNADLALYRAKDAGGNAHFTYEPALHAHAEERRRLEFALRRALERNEFHLHFQPVVDAASDSIVSFEALLRWNSTEHGNVSPSKFIPLAEDTRLVVPIGEWVLNNACHEATKWPDHVRVAVNVSGEQLLDTNFAACVVNALCASGLPASRLELEVTESIFLRDPSLARAALEQVMALGCSVALDDFGTGYSSLGYLRNLRFSTIKIDRSFVHGAATGNPESLAIVRAVVAMADSLGMSTTAEGAETQHEVDVIRQLGCRKIQGYFFGHPVSATDVGRLLHGHRRDHSRIVA